MVNGTSLTPRQDREPVGVETSVNNELADSLPAPVPTSPTHSNHKSTNLIYQLQCTACKALYIVKFHHSLSPTA